MTSETLHNHTVSCCTLMMLSNDRLLKKSIEKGPMSSKLLNARACSSNLTISFEASSVAAEAITWATCEASHGRVRSLL